MTKIIETRTRLDGEDLVLVTREWPDMCRAELYGMTVGASVQIVMLQIAETRDRAVALLGRDLVTYATRVLATIGLGGPVGPIGEMRDAEDDGA